MTIKNSVINTFNRIGFDHVQYLNQAPVTAMNRFTGEICTTSSLIGALIEWVYSTSDSYERGDFSVNVSDFDRIRYFILEADKNAYNICID